MQEARFSPGELLSAALAARVLDCTSQHVRNLIRAGEIQALRVGHQYVVARAELERFAAERAAKREGRT